MLKYVDTLVSFQEIPNEISLCINISNCPCACVGCHSPWLAQDIGTILNSTELNRLIDSNRGISCVCLMGGDADPSYIDVLAKDIHVRGLKSAWYSGRPYLSENISTKNFDYIKLGPYIEDLGGLQSKKTNQVMFQIDHVEDKDFILDITSKFWK